MQQYSNLRDPRHPRPRFRRIEVNMPLQPCHQQRWRAPRRSTSNISSQDARNREPASRHHTKVGDLLLQAPLQAKPARVLPQYDERSHSTSLDSQPIHGGADATGQSAIANDATAPTHRRRNPGESLHGGPTLPEPAIPPVAVGHEREPIRQGLRRYGFDMTRAGLGARTNTPHYQSTSMYETPTSDSERVRPRGPCDGSETFGPRCRARRASPSPRQGPRTPRPAIRSGRPGSRSPLPR